LNYFFSRLVLTWVALFLLGNHFPIIAGTEGTGGTPKPTLNSKPFGIINGISGVVKIYRKLKEIELKKGDVVQEKDLIKTLKNSTINIQLSRDNNIFIAENSKVKLNTDSANKNIELNLSIGSLRCKLDNLSAKQSFKVKSPSAVAGVRGTDFITQYKPELGAKAFNVCVISGTVEVAGLDKITSKLSKPAFVKRNQNIFVSKTGIPAVIKIVAVNQMKSIMNKFPVKTNFIKAKKGPSAKEKKPKGKKDKKKKEPKSDKKPKDSKDKKPKGSPDKKGSNETSDSENSGSDKSKSNDSSESESSESDSTESMDSSEAGSSESDNTESNDSSEAERSGSENTESTSTETEVESPTTEPVDNISEPITPEIETVEIDIPLNEINDIANESTTDDINEAVQNEVKEIIQEVITDEKRKIKGIDFQIKF